MYMFSISTFLNYMSNDLSFWIFFFFLTSFILDLVKGINEGIYWCIFFNTERHLTHVCYYIHSNFP